MLLFLVALPMLAMAVDNHDATFVHRTFDGDYTTYVYRVRVHADATDAEAVNFYIPDCPDGMYHVHPTRYNEKSYLGQHYYNFDHQTKDTEVEYSFKMKGDVISTNIEIEVVTLQLLHGVMEPVSGDTTVEGPSCSLQAPTICDAGAVEYTGTCENGQTEIQLDGTGSQEATTFTWTAENIPSTAYFENQLGASTKLVIPGSTCKVLGLVRLTLNNGETDCTARISVDDTTPPVITLTPDVTDATVACGDLPAEPASSASDNCDTTTAVNFEESIVDSAHAPIGDSRLIEVRVRTWSTKDSCGNVASETQTIHVVDYTPPTISNVPNDADLDCSHDNAPCEPEAFDECDHYKPTLEFTEEIQTLSCDDSYDVTRSWQASDSVGNTFTDSQTIRVRDTVAPTLIGVPDDYTLECPMEPAENDCHVQADDNCDADVDFQELITTVGGCGSTYVRTHEFIATDNCANSVTDSYAVTVQDTTPPVLSDTADDRTVECTSGYYPEPCDVTAYDACDGSLAVEWSSTQLPGSEDCTGSYAVVFTFHAVDSCGNEAMDSHTVSVVDTTPPAFTSSIDDGTADCSNVPYSPPSASDECDGAVPVEVSVVRTDTSCESEYLLTRTYFAQDDCGNSVTDSQVINVTDNMGPSWIVTLSNISDVECDDDVDYPAIGVTDVCDGPDTVDPVVSRISGSCPNEYTVVKEYSYSDCAGHSIYQLQTVGVVDTTPPALQNVPGDQEYEIDSLPPSFSPGIVTATDECGDATVEFSEIKSPGGCTHNYTIIRTWTATDECGNTATDLQTVEVYDTTPPSITNVPYSQAYDCASVPDFYTEVNNTDNSEVVGGVIEYTFSESDTKDVESCDYEIYRLWSAVDECSNYAEETQTLIVKDETDPFWVTDPLPQSVTYECTHDGAETLVADDACHDVTVQFSEVKTPTTCDEYTLKRTWVAEDECGNDIEHIQNVVVEDTEAPSLYGIPSQITVSCDDIPAAAEPTANDTCEGNLTDQISFVQTIGTYDCDDSFWLVRTWTVKDCGGLSDTGEQSIYVEDDEPPSFDNLPDSVTINCTETHPDWENITACDNCDDDVPVLSGRSPALGSCGGDVVVSFTAKDDCGNTAEDTRTITVVDDVYPYWTYTPNNMTVQCEAPAPTHATAADACGSVTVLFTEKVIHEGDCDSEFWLERTWEACDQCSNCIEHVATVYVDDTEDPTWFTHPLPQDMTRECDETYEAPALEANDTCNEVTVTQTLVKADPADPNCPDEFVITHSYYAVDSCGEDTEHSFTETVLDREPPVISDVPTGDDFECDIPVREDPNFTDNCDDSPAFSFTELVTEHCVGKYDVCRTWYVEDNCGNFNEYEWCFAVDDTTPPYWTALDQTDDQSHDDDCSDVTMTCVETQGPCPTDYVLVKECTIADDCGSTNSWTWTFPVVDTTPPTLHGVPDHDQHFDCDDILPDWTLVNVTGKNVEIDDGIEVDHTMNVEYTCTGGDGQIIIHTWHAEDCAGNENEESRTIIVTDTEPPIVTMPPDDTIDCADIPSFVPTYTDNCDENLAITQGQSEDDDKYWYEICAEDNCGNSACAEQTLTIVDTEPPELSCIPVNQTVTCGSDWDHLEVDMSATDNCGNATVVVSQWLIPGSCPCEYTLVWAWEASDGFANSNSTSYSIAFEDNTPPFFIWDPSIVPVSMEVQVDNIPRPPTVTAFDSEQNETVDVEYSQVRIEIPDDDKCFNLTRTWYAVDECGNENEHEITIKVCDHVPPTIIGTPADAPYPCSATIPDIAEVTFLLQHYADEGTVITVSEFVEPSVVCDQEYEIYRTWEAVDPVGNVNTETQTITVTDDAPPILYLNGVAVTSSNIFTGQDSRTPYCEEENITLTANDTCIQDGDAVDPYNVPVVVTATRIPASPTPQQEQLITTFTATDDCGNQAQYTDTQVIYDTVIPYWTTNTHDLPNDIYVNCTDIPDAPTLEADDNCSYANVSITSTPTPGTCGEEETIEHCYQAEDAVGNVNVMHCYTVHVIDDTPPQFDATIATDLTMECDECVDPPNMTATDICDGPVPVQRTVGSKPVCEGNYDVIYEAVDDCGNDINHTITVSVEDNTPPMIHGVPSSYSLSCFSIEPVPPLVINDTCDASPSDLFTEYAIDDVCDYEYKVVREFVAEDCAGNSAEESYTIEVKHSNDFGLFVEPAEEVYTCECSDSCETPSAVANSTCAGNIPVTDTVHEQTGTGAESRLIYIFHATDTCEEDTQYRTVFIVDTTPPSIEAPPDATADCETFVPGIPDLVTLDDNCDDDPAVSASEWIVYDCPGNYTVYRKWIAEDANGNMNETTQTIDVSDNSAPVFDGTITNQKYVCNYTNDQDLTATDTCGNDVTVYYTEVELALAYIDEADVIIAGASPSEVIGAYVRTWVAIDECGLSTEECDTAYIVDEDYPDFDDKPANESYPCDGIVPIVPPTPTDPCDPDPQMNVTATPNNTCPHEYTIVYTWTVVDWVNHHNTYSATVTVYDDEPPAFDTIPDAESGPHECDAPSFDDIDASDNCDIDPQTTKWSNRTYDCANVTYTELRTWRAVDVCGNVNEVEQTVYVVDTTPPNLYNVPGTVSIECDEFMPSDPVTADDDCALNAVTLESTDAELVDPADCPSDYRIIRTWVATDPCGNEATDQQTVKVYDTTPPVLSGYPVGDITLDCKEDLPVETVDACDNCDETVVTAGFTEEVSGPYYNLTYIRYWWAADECENEADAIQTIQVIDMTPPNIYAPEDRTVDCVLPSFEDPEANDTCDLEVIPVETVTRVDLSCPDSYWLIRDWYVADDAGNSATAQQSIRVKDTNAPTTMDLVVDGETVTSECNHTPTDDVNWTDDCGEVTDEFSEIVVPGTDVQELYTVYRTWTAEDECGNDSEYTATIIVKDTTPPTFVPYDGNSTFECDSVPVGDLLPFYDDCTEATGTWTETSDSNCTYNYTITRTYEFVDEVGNKNSTTYTIYIDDTVDPEIHDVNVSDVTLEYGSYGTNWTDIPAQTGYDTDNCGTYTYTNDRSVIPTTCPEVFSIVQVFTAVDECQNDFSISQTTYVVDTTPPRFTDYPDDITVECDAVPDVCDVEVENEDYPIYMSTTGTAASGSIIYTWYAEDCSGNGETHSQTVTVDDTAPPVLTRGPQDEVVPCDCDTFPAFVTIDAIDNCDSTVTVDSDEERVNTTSEDEYVLIRTWTATDVSGNTVTHKQTVTVFDDVPPEIDYIRQTIFEPCDDVSHVTELFAWDNCDPDPVLLYSEVKQGGSCPETYQLLRNWESFDRSGNAESREQTVYVHDSDAPTGIELNPGTCIYPANGNYVKYEDATTSLFNFADNCDEDFTVSILSCNTTQTASNSDCFWDASSDILWVKAVRNEGEGSGREYTITVQVTDGCDNTNTFTKDFFVPHDDDVYEDYGKCCDEGTHENAV